MSRRRKLVTDRPCALLPYDYVAGRCARCGRKLIGAQRRWCGPECQSFYEVNHYWQLARPAALRRDMFRCRKCAQLPARQRHDQDSSALEVNHRIPRVGRGYAAGCHHHQGNLETLCHYHHVMVTRRQRIARARIKVRRGDEAQAALAQREVVGDAADES